MCTSIIEVTRAEGMAKRGDEWFPLSHSVVAYDHARHANLGDVITLDFVNASLEVGARAVEAGVHPDVGVGERAQQKGQDRIDDQKAEDRQQRGDPQAGPDLSSPILVAGADGHRTRGLGAACPDRVGTKTQYLCT